MKPSSPRCWATRSGTSARAIRCASRRNQTLAGILGAGAAIFTGSAAVADLANIGGQALLSGYGRDMELEADHLGAQYIAKTGYDPQAMIGVIGVLKNQEVTNSIAHARKGASRASITVCSRAILRPTNVCSRRSQASRRAQSMPPPTRASARRTICTMLKGLPFGTSSQQGIVRDNRFYHAGLGITIAFPKDWVVENQHEPTAGTQPDE